LTGEQESRGEDRDRKAFVVVGWGAGSFCLALAIYWGALYLHTGEAFPQSRWPYFEYYAQSLLDGHLYFTRTPPSLSDLSFYGDRLYMHFPPFPSILMAPLVKIFGADLPGRFLCVLLASLNGALFLTLLHTVHRRGLISAPPATAVPMALFYLFGTVHFYCAVTSNPWELAHVVCNLLLLAALICALSERYLLACALLVAVLFTRTHIVLVFPLILLLYVRGARTDGRSPREIALGALPHLGILAGGVLLLLAFNHARFDDVFENGISYHRMHPLFRERFERYGYFDIAYVGRNLFAMFLQPPVSLERFPYFSFSPKGLSIFLASPLYLCAVFALRRERLALALPLVGVVALCLIPVFLLMGTGEFQFGHRYSSDLQVLLCLLVILGLRDGMNRTSLTLLVLSILMSSYGAWWFVSNFAN
jgi:hypothetical protein